MGEEGSLSVLLSTEKAFVFVPFISEKRLLI
jgi:hypothetical protein